MTQQLVLVTGGTGFIAQHCILILRQGFAFVARCASCPAKQVRDNLRNGGARPGDLLSFVAAGWRTRKAGPLPHKDALT
jgi:dihydroflavonol-4-reductase